MAKPLIPVDTEAVERHAAAGLAEYQIAAALGMSADTFTKRKRDTPGVAEALARGRAAAIGTVENVAYRCATQAATDPRYQASMMFWLKANAGWKERSVVETVQTDAAGESRDELAARIERLAKRIAGRDGGVAAEA